MLNKTYHPTDVEERIYKQWEEENCFTCDPNAQKEPYTIMMPPPNVTGSLHIGHALTFTIQDVLVRYWRMQGKDVLWQPGTDHAGIATQMVVERQLDDEGISRHDLGRKEFLDRVWSWKERSGGEIISQLRRLGASADWERQRFTMDEGLSEAVRKVFVQLYKDGLIYRDKRLVNWDKKLETAISDLEVEQKEVNGKMWYFRYPIEDSDEHIIVATTRPETMLGDTAVAVHPDDERYAHLKGKFVILPIMQRKIPIVFDIHADPEKGTGAVKITPAHDFNDFEVAKRHNLPMINIFTADIRLNDHVPDQFKGLPAEEARAQVLAEMEQLGLLERSEEHRLQQPFGDRSGVIIEPWLMDQWFVDAPKLAKKALEAVENDITKFIPKQWENTYFEWMRNIQPWCISRQLWWGHQIPVWYGPGGVIFCEETEEQAKQAAFEHFGEHVQLTQESDVLDTWFSSALWPFSTLGWPEETKELERYYPSNVLITGFDIIFFWVARMMMMGLYFKGEVPFHDIYIHALVRDEKGQKMSKSKGNVIDPLEIMEQYGTDALRLALTAMAAQGRDVRMSKPVIETYRNFVTKLWNTARFIEMNECVYHENFDVQQVKSDINKWIIAKASYAVQAVSSAIEAYRFNEAALSGYHFVWNEFCAWFIEFAKPVFAEGDPQAISETKGTAIWILEKILRVMHPIIPFMTEELYQLLIPKDQLLAKQPWPDQKEFPLIDEQTEALVEKLIKLISKIRTLRSEMSVKPSLELELYISTGEGQESLKQWIEMQFPLIKRLARISKMHFTTEDFPSGCVQDVVGELNIALPLKDVIDISAEIVRLEKEIGKQEKEIQIFKGKLSNANFVERAPDAVVEEQRIKLRDALSAKERLSQALDRFKALDASE